MIYKNKYYFYLKQISQNELLNMLLTIMQYAYYKHYTQNI